MLTPPIRIALVLAGLALLAPARALARLPAVEADPLVELLSRRFCAKQASPGSKVLLWNLAENELAVTVPKRPFAKRSHTPYGKILETSGLDPEATLVVGFRHTGHVYLVVDGVRYDGKIILKEVVQSDASYTSDTGTLFFFDIGSAKMGDLKAALQQRLARPQHSLTCVQGMCRLLNQAGLTDGTTNVLPMALFDRLRDEGLLRDGGRRVPVSMLLSDAELDRARAVLSRITKQRVTGVAIIGTVSGFGIVVFVKGVAKELVYPGSLPSAVPSPSP